jgi:long-chain acyl-CoA synthetase
MFYSRFLETVERFPTATAVEMQRSAGTPGNGSSSYDGVERYNYVELRRMSDSIGRWLQQNGVTGGARCAILAANSPRWLATHLGIVAAGNAVVPLDTAFHADQVTKLLVDSGASLLFVDQKFRTLAERAVADMSVRLVSIDDSAQDGQSLDAMFAAGPGNFVAATSGPDDLACILYTSGTTSDPKGVMLTQANLRAEMEAVFQFIRLDHTDALLGVLPLFHALAQMANLLLPIVIGGKVVYLESLNTTELMRALRERDITIFCCVPQFFYLLRDRIFSEAHAMGKTKVRIFRSLLFANRMARKLGLNPGKVFFKKVHNLLGPKMRYLVTGGSRFDAAIGRDFEALGFTVLQAYGLTEVTGGSHCTRPEHNVMGSIGPPLPGVESKILSPQAPQDGTGPPVGEILIRGNTVMRGYYNRPDATAAVIDSEGWFHSGDLGYVDDGGNFFITGRAKEVIVLSSGKNIYPEEIEDYYLKSPWIKEICVLGLEGKPGEPKGERLHGVVVPNFEVLRQKKIVNTREVIRFDIENVSAGLPPAKRILSYEIWQEDLPRTTTRKLRRFEIEKKVHDKLAHNLTADTPIERELSPEEQEWMQFPEVQKALEFLRKSSKVSTAKLHPRDNLELDLGLDSMERVELLTALEQALGADVHDTAASEVYTVREVVDLVRSHIGKTAAQIAGWDTILAAEVTDPAVLAITRKRYLLDPLWYLFGKAVTIFAEDKFHLQIRGMEKMIKKGPFIISPNHQSFLDAPLLTAALPWDVFHNVFYVGTSEIFGGGLWRQFAKFLRLIPVDPDANLVPAMRAGAYGLRSNKVLMLYPEGERSIDGTPKPFKKGAAILAHHLNVPIVPVALDGFFEAWPRGKSFQEFSHLQIEVLDPIYPDPKEPAEKAYDRLTAELRARIVAAWNRMHAKRFPTER